MFRSFRRMAVELFFLLPVALLVACSGTAGPTPKSATTPGQATAPVEFGSLDRNVRTMALDTARSMLGVAYRYGGADPRGFDCSGLVHYSYAKAGLELPRTSQDIFRASQLVNPGNLRAGDLVFFTISSKKIAHVGIYAGNKRFIHAPSSGKGVSYASLETPYWKNRLVAVGRF
jgi:cell wall-associated NlpC family hydrolase